MPHLFTVRWPYFARLEAALFFPLAVRLASEIEPVRKYAERVLIPALSPQLVRFGTPANWIFWAALAILVIVPYFVLLIVTDRFLTIRKGFALLSVFSIALWTAAALRWSGPLMAFVPESLLKGSLDKIDWLPPGQKIALAAGGLAVLLHLKALWTGLTDDGGVAVRLIAARNGDAHVAQPVDQSRYMQELYHHQSASFRQWQPEQQLDGLRVAPRASPVVKFLVAITWSGVVAAVAFAWLNWHDLNSAHGKSAAAPVPAASSSQFAEGTNSPAPAVTSHVTQTMPLTNVHVITAGPLPSVQRPTEISASTQTSSAISGPNEAVTERGNDGSFAFDAVVNGAHVRMLFDTGASVVGLRSEDAERLGIPLTRLTYSAKIKTANGTADVAPVMIDTMLIGNITLRNVPGFVAKEGMLQQNLLGQTFLARLSGYNVEKNLLVLKGR